MNVKLLAAAACCVGLVAAVPATAAGPATSAALVIRHQVRGCHSWSANGGPYLPSQLVRLARGGSLTVTNNDVMPHRLIQTGGPKVKPYTVSAGMMGHMGATVRVSFPASGTYHFTTHAGEDYMRGVKTAGPDNVLRLTVTVS
jgi:plastocyanin